MRGLRHLATLVVAQLAVVLDSFVDRNPRNALLVWQGDKEVDALYVSLFRELLSYTMEDPGTISLCIHSQRAARTRAFRGVNRSLGLTVYCWPTLWQRRVPAFAARLSSQQTRCVRPGSAF
jgi:hypothetical protein